MTGDVFELVHSPRGPCGGRDPLERDREALERGVTAVLCTYDRPASLVRAVESLAAQTERPARLVVVDAGPDRASAAALERSEAFASAAGCAVYARVGGRLRGLTRQRNFALGFVSTDLVAFFDDDVVLRPECLREMESAMRSAPGAAGVGAEIENERAPSAVWRARRLLGIVPHLVPGRYTRTGMSIPWGFLSRESGTAPLVAGDWLPGCGMMWRTELARELKFHEPFEGYAQGEDLDFSLRARDRGGLYLARRARLAHLQEPAGRPDDFRMGYAAIFNRFEIHRRAFPKRRAGEVAAFLWAWSLDSLLLARGLLVPSRVRRTARHLAGRAAAARDLLAGRSPVTTRRTSAAASE
jgi:GT2 family glycosyltransferase